MTLGEILLTLPKLPTVVAPPSIYDSLRVAAHASAIAGGKKKPDSKSGLSWRGSQTGVTGQDAGRNLLVPEEKSLGFA